jgi:hypothetical protein
VVSWWRTGPTMVMTVDRTATPMAPPSCRLALNTVDARPVAAGEMVAKAAACMLNITCGMAYPRPNINNRIHHRLVWAPLSDMRAVNTAMDTSPPAMTRRGPKRGYSTRLTTWAPSMTPMASGNVLSPDCRAERPRPSW